MHIAPRLSDRRMNEIQPKDIQSILDGMALIRPPKPEPGKYDITGVKMHQAIQRSTMGVFNHHVAIQFGQEEYATL